MYIILPSTTQDMRVTRWTFHCHGMSCFPPLPPARLRSAPDPIVPVLLALDVGCSVFLSPFFCIAIV